ncbi:MAG TPA: DNA-binding protein [Spirochaetia bacterium]|nr:DNA-binding protein [Spirochaetia bacterium]
MIDFSIYAKKKPEVFAHKCPNCGTLDYPAPMICKSCSTRRDPSGVIFSAWEKVPLTGRCKLLAWTRVFALPEGFDVQYMLFGIVLFANGLKASGRLLCDKPAAGMELEAKTGIIREQPGETIYGLIFDVP